MQVSAGVKKGAVKASRSFLRILNLLPTKTSTPTNSPADYHEFRPQYHLKPIHHYCKSYCGLGDHTSTHLKRLRSSAKTKKLVEVLHFSSYVLFNNESVALLMVLEVFVSKVGGDGTIECCR